MNYFMIICNSKNQKNIFEWWCGKTWVLKSGDSSIKVNKNLIRIKKTKVKLANQSINIYLDIYQKPTLKKKSN